MDPPPTPKRRPVSAYYPPPSPSSSAHVHRPYSPPPSPSKQHAGLGRRPTHGGHRSTSSLSSLAQLNLASPSMSPSLGPSHSPSLSRAGGHGWDPAEYSSTLRRSNSILTSSATPWGERTHYGAQGGGAHAGASNGSSSFEAVQERTFLRWTNSRLEKSGFPPLTDLESDLRDGTRLIQLVGSLTGESLGRFNYQPYLRVQKVENAAKALDRVKEMGVHLTNIGPEDIVDGHKKLILGLIWSLVLRFSIADINEEGSLAKEGLLLWAQRRTAPYKEVDVQDFSASWRDGLAFCALIHAHRPDLLDYQLLRKDPSAAAENLEKAFAVAEESLGIPRLLEVDDLVGTRRPDERSVMTYVAQYFHAFSSRAQAETEAKVISRFLEETSGLMLAVHDYERRVSALLTALRASLSALAASPPSSSTPYPALLSARAALAAHKRGPKREWAREKLDTQELLGNIKVKLETYRLRGYDPPEGLRVEVVADAWKELTAAEAERGRLVAGLIQRLQEESRARYLAQADALDRALSAAQAELGALSSPAHPLHTQLDRLARLSSARLPSLRSALAAVRAAEEECAACDALGAIEGQADGAHEMQERVEALEGAVRARRAFVENQMVARKATTLTPEQLEELSTAFRTFDKEGKNALDLNELDGALGSLGVPKVDLDELKQDADGLVHFEEFLRFMTEQAEERPSAGRLRALFRSAAEDKPFLTDLDIARLSLPSTAVAFLKDYMPRWVSSGEVDGAPAGAEGEGGEGEYDYQEFLKKFCDV
ncbi:alpha-actinin [Rhodotorula kratochvilovae]